MWLALTAAVVGTMCVALVNRNFEGPHLSLWLSSTNYLTSVSLITTNIILGLLGVFRFTGAQNLPVSNVFGLGMLLMAGYYFGYRFRRRQFTTRDALAAGMFVTYLVSIFLSLLRLPVPPDGVPFDISSYLFGNRYLFSFAVPLILSFGVMIMPLLARAPKPYLYIAIATVCIYGFVLQANYSQIDKAITNPARAQFYDLTPAAIQQARQQQVTLPDLRSDLLFAGSQVPLHQAIYFRKVAQGPPLHFKDPAELSELECRQLLENQTLRTWLNIYQNGWCGV